MATTGSLLGDLKTPSSAIIMVLVLVLLHRTASNYLYNKKYKLPPRIPGIPLFGNTFQLPPTQQGLWGIEQARKYGEMCVPLLL